MSYIEQLQQRLRDAESECSRLRSEIALRDRCIAWCISNGVSMYGGRLWWDPQENNDFQTLTDQLIPAEFAAILSGKADSEVAK